MITQYSRDVALKAMSEESPERLAKNLQVIVQRGGQTASDLELGDSIAKHLSHTDACVVASAVSTLGQSGLSQYAGEISGLLKHDDEKVRFAAAVALGNFGADAMSASAALAEVAGKSKETVKVRAAAIQALGKIGSEDEASVITSALDDKSPELVSAACTALGSLTSLGEDKAKDIANKLEEHECRYAAVRALGNLGSDACKRHAAKIVDLALTDADQGTRTAASQALAGLGDDSAAQEIVELLSRKSPAIKAAAAFTLGSMGELAKEYEKPIAALLKDDGEDQMFLPLQVGGGSNRSPAALRKPRCAALYALGTMGSESQASGVAELLDSGDWEVRLAATEALSHMPGTAGKMIEKVAGLLSDTAFYVRAQACYTLGELKAEDYADDIAKCLEDKSPSVRGAAASALGRLCDAGMVHIDKIFELTLDASSGVKACAVRGLGSLHAGAYAGIVAKCLWDADENVRYEACVALGAMGVHGGAFSDELRSVQADPVDFVCEAATEALEKLSEDDTKAIADD